ncbi:hypothetical protein A7U60_g2828 [Sanghuangporus baumii]|uniref:Uncharacterized protein n=1 Tax=Sanghuangporus baumii TaxID=108892 RepID=A0A9Q5NAC2_SANBA|nr:hypothetical protein A7U60_g2828 [Sanghuangporus baumii]
MLAAPTAAPGLVKSRSAMSDGNLSDYEPSPGLRSNIAHRQPILQMQKFPHTRAQLANIAREHRFRSANSASSISNGSESEAGDRDLQGYDEEPENRVSSDLVHRVAALLDEEKEDEVKELLKKTFEMDDESTEGPVLDLMHAHKDDISGVPFLFLTPTRRPISRPSSRTSNHSFRLAPGPPRADSPCSIASGPSSPSLLGPGPIRRPHTPVMSPLATGGHSATSYINAPVTNSPSSSPTFPHKPPAFLATSLPASPLSSPRLLNAKAAEFRPAPRPLSAASTIPGTSGSFIGRRNETPSPDLWAHGPGSLRGASRLAIASPLIPDNSLLPPGTPPRAHTPTSPLRISSQVGDEDEEDDPFDPFAQSDKLNTAPTFHSISTSTNSTEFESSSSMSEEGALWGGAYPHPSTSYPDMFGEFDKVADPVYGPMYYTDQQQMQMQGTAGNGAGSNGAGTEDFDSDQAAALTDGMTPFDVLSSVFGATLAPSELEEALTMNGYDFERAMQWLVDRARPAPPSSGSARVHGQQNYVYAGDGVHVVPRGLLRGGRGGFGGGRGATGRYGNGNGTGRPPAQTNNRVCRYFLQGECLRADCRFSHDLDRALCRFWLRGTCAKGETCEFLHRLPNEVDVQGLQSVMSQTTLSENKSSLGDPALDEFPTLSNEAARGGTRRGYGRGVGYDPSRARFANAVKKSAPFTPGSGGAEGLAAQLANRREAKAALGDSVFSRPTVVAPRPSPRIRLRGPILLPTLSSGEAVSALYMAYRSRALQLGAARNACLSRAADAWRRGDGAAAKRFSREGHDLNARMAAESAEAASKLVRERVKNAEAAVRARDASWSSDPADRGVRGKTCGAGLGVLLGVVSKDGGGGGGNEMVKLTQEERTEAALDLHGLHSNEATEVLEEFLLALEKENFFGLAFVIVGEEKHTGTQDPGRGASRQRLATGIREWLHNWGYPWMERDGIVCVDPLTHMQ